MSKMRRILSGGEDGFTLIELLVVIAVLGILAAIAIPRWGGVTDKARNAEYQSTAGSIRSAMEMYYAEYGDYPGSSLAGVDGEPGDWDALTNILDEYVEFSDLDNYDDTSETFYSYSGSTTDSSYTIKLTNDATGTVFTITPGGVSDS